MLDAGRHDLDRTRLLHRHTRSARSFRPTGRIRLGRGDGRLPDRGRRRTSRRFDLGSDVPRTRSDQRRFGRPDGVRSRQPVRRGRLAHAGAGLDAYRFSISWRGCNPEAPGPSRPRLDFYDRLVDALLAADVAPWVTLYHWDLPQELSGRRRLAGARPARPVRRLCGRMHAALGDRVGIGHLERAVVLGLAGLRLRGARPGDRRPGTGGAGRHHLLLAHGRAIEAMRAQAPQITSWASR